MFAGIYRDFAGKSECGDFKFTGIACIPTSPVIFEVNKKKVWTFYIYILLRFFKFPYNFCGLSGVHVIFVIITCTLQGMFCDMGIHRTFYGGKICSVPLLIYLLKQVCKAKEATFYGFHHQIYLVNMQSRLIPSHKFLFYISVTGFSFCS